MLIELGHHFLKSEILDYLPISSLMKVAATCRFLRRIVIMSSPECRYLINLGDRYCLEVIEGLEDVIARCMREGLQWIIRRMHDHKSSLKKQFPEKFGWRTYGKEWSLMVYRRNDEFRELCRARPLTSRTYTRDVKDLATRLIMMGEYELYLEVFFFFDLEANKEPIDNMIYNCSSEFLLFLYSNGLGLPPSSGMAILMYST